MAHSLITTWTKAGGALCGTCALLPPTFGSGRLTAMAWTTGRFTGCNLDVICFSARFAWYTDRGGHMQFQVGTKIQDVLQPR